MNKILSNIFFKLISGHLERRFYNLHIYKFFEGQLLYFQHSRNRDRNCNKTLCYGCWKGLKTISLGLLVILLGTIVTFWTNSLYLKLKLKLKSSKNSDFLSMQLEREEAVLSVGPRADKFSLVSSDHGRTPKCDFSVFDRKYRFWANLFKRTLKSSVKFDF